VSRQLEAMVVGAGPAGASTAITLLRAGVSVSILACDDSCSCLPAEVLSPEVRSEFQRLGLSENFLDETISSYGIEATWGHAAPAFHPYICNALGPGFHVGRARFHQALLKAVSDAGDCPFIRGRFLTAKRTPSGWTVTIRIGDVTNQLDCRLLVDATGRSATVARFLGARRRRLDSLCGVSSVLNKVVREQTLVVEAAPYGWWYLAPIPASRTLICMISDVDIIHRLAVFRPRGWLDLLKSVPSLSTRLGHISDNILTRTHPCESGILDRICGDMWIAVGDAASVVDPLSSRGVPKALRSGREAGNAIVSYLRGNESALRRYSRVHREEFQNYLETKERQYGMELRWRGETFWKRRTRPQDMRPKGDLSRPAWK